MHIPSKESAMTDSTPSPVFRAADFIESIGINTHIDFTWTSYANTQKVIDSINYIGVKNLRDSANNSSDLGANGLWQRVADATGAQFSAFISSNTTEGMTTRLNMVQQLAQQGIIEYIEGANEADSGFNAAGNLQLGAQFQQQVHMLGTQLGIPVINMSFGQGWDVSSTGNYGAVGDLTAYAEYANAHTYFGTGNAPDATIDLINSATQLAAHRPVIATEMGWYTTGVQSDPNSVSESVQAKYMLDALLYSYQTGTVKTYLYELLDRQKDSNSDNNFGLFHADGTPKAAATALHNLTTLLADSGTGAASFTTHPLNYALNGLTSSDHSMLIEKSDGTHWIALWNETRLSSATVSADIAVPNHTVTLTLPANSADITIYDPLTGTSVIQAANGVRSIDISLPDHPVLIQISNLHDAAPIVVAPPVIYQPTDLALLAPATATITLNDTKAIAGVAIDNPWAASAGGNVIVNINVNRGTLQIYDAAGNAVAGSGGKSINLTGSLAEVNAKLATLAYHAPGLEGADAVRFDVWNQAGIHATGTIAVTDQSPYSKTDLTIAAPGSVTLDVGAAKIFTGLSISNPWSDTASGKVTAILSVSKGTMDVTDGTGQAVAGSGGHSITLTGSVAEINARLATLNYHAPNLAGADNVRLDVWNQAGIYASKNIAVTDRNPYDSRDITFTAPAAATALLGETKSLGLLAVSNPWSEHQSGNLSATVSATKGTLNITDAAGAAVTGSGTSTIRLVGSLAEINARLATLNYHAPNLAGTDAVRLDIWNQAGITASRSITVADNAIYNKNDISVSASALGSVVVDADRHVDGVVVSNPWALTATGVMSAIVSSARGSVGMTDDAGHALAGSGGSSLRISGTLAEINARLATLNYHTPTIAGNDSLRVDVWNQAGVNANKTIAITDTNPFIKTAIGIIAAKNITLGLSDTVHPGDVAIGNEWARHNTGNVAVNVTASRGTIDITNAAGSAVAGSGTGTIRMSGTLDQINAQLATLDYHGTAGAGTGTLKIDIWNQAGAYASSTIAVKSIDTSGAPTLQGTADKDILAAGSSAANLRGGAGADVFYFDKSHSATGSNASHILDFSQSEGDRVQLHGFGLNAGNFVGSGELSGAKSFGFDASHANDANNPYTLVRLDTNGDHVADHEIRLDGFHGSMHESDFSFA